MLPRDFKVDETWHKETRLECKFYLIIKPWRREKVASRPDDRHFGTQNIDQRWQLIEARPHQKAPRKSYITMTATSKPEHPDVLIIVAIHMLDREYRSLGFES